MKKDPAQPPHHSEDRVISALHLTYWDARIVEWLARHGITLMRIALGLVFLWFGILKYFPGLSAAQHLAAQTVLTLTFGHILPAVSLPMLATWECAIALGLLSGSWPRVTLLLLCGQMLGTLLPLFFFPAETWEHIPYAPTLAGQYIIKNLVFVTAASVIGATARGGHLVADANTTQEAKKPAATPPRFRRRFKRGP